jgi:murein hydrolase activator
MNKNLFSSMLIVLACIVSAGFKVELAWSAPKKTPAKQDLTDIKARISALKRELNTSQEAHKDAADELKESEQAISATNQKLYEINQQQKRNQQILAKLNVESENLHVTLEKQQALLGQQLYQQYLHGQQSYAQLMLQDAHPSILARDVHYYRYVATARAKLIQSMQANLTKVDELNAETARALEETVQLKQKQLAERQTLEQEKAEKSKVIKSLSSKIAAQRNEIKKLTRDEKRLTQLFERLAKIVPATPKPSKKTTITNTPSPQKVTPTTNNTTPTDEFSGVRFASLRGKLKLPVRGSIINRYGSQREDSGISWKGLFISANEGEAVKSVAEGRVVFSDWLRGFGNLVIVDHGSGYMSLYGNNQATLKQVGDVVSAGDVIASVGNSGGNEMYGLYYELRSQSKPFDPLSWSVVR